MQDRNLLLFGIVSLLSSSLKFTFKLTQPKRLIANSRNILLLYSATPFLAYKHISTFKISAALLLYNHLQIIVIFDIEWIVGYLKLKIFLKFCK